MANKTIDAQAGVVASSIASLAGKYLTFTLDRESYGLPVLKVREIIRLPVIRSVPNLPMHVRGVINLRGKIVPVVDLRLRFGFAEASSTDQSCIVVVQVTARQGGTNAMGLIVDAVEEVVQIAAGELEPTPDFGQDLNTDYLLGMAKVKGVVKALLDIDRILVGDLSALENVTM